MRVLDLFSGIGGFAYAGHLLGGFTTLDFVEEMMGYPVGWTDLNA